MMRILACITACAVLAASVGRLEAQKSRSSGSSGRSYSSGSRSTPSPSSSGTSGKSYSSGPPRSSTPPTSSPSTKTSPAPAGKSYSSGSAAKPSTTPAVPARKSYSSGSPSSTSSPPKTFTPPAAPSGKSYTSGSSPKPSPAPSAATPSAPSGRSYTPPSSRPGPGYDSLAAEAQRREESRAAYSPAPAPKPQYTDPRTKATYDLDREQDRRIDQLRRDLDHERWVNRHVRRDRWYTGYPGSGWTTVYYRDPYGDWFWWWILSQSLETRAAWAYHHRNYIDEARYRELLRRDAQLEAKIRQLEAERVTRDPKYAPGDVDYDLMFDDSYVDAVYNPTYDPTRVTPISTTPSQSSPAPSSPSGGSSVVIWLIVIAVVVFVIWLVFFKRWSVPKA